MLLSDADIFTLHIYKYTLRYTITTRRVCKWGVYMVQSGDDWFIHMIYWWQKFASPVIVFYWVLVLRCKKMWENEKKKSLGTRCRKFGIETLFRSVFPPRLAFLSVTKTIIVGNTKELAITSKITEQAITLEIAILFWVIKVWRWHSRSLTSVLWILWEELFFQSTS